MSIFFFLNLACFYVGVYLFHVETETHTQKMKNTAWVACDVM